MAKQQMILFDVELDLPMFNRLTVTDSLEPVCMIVIMMGVN